MVSTADHQSADIPSTQLGWHFSGWTRADMRTILNLYEEAYRPKASKLELFRLLDGVTTRHALTRRDRTLILNAKKDGSPLPAAKPTVAINEGSMAEVEMTDAPMTTTSTQPSDNPSQSAHLLSASTVARVAIKKRRRNVKASIAEERKRRIQSIIAANARQQGEELSESLDDGAPVAQEQASVSLKQNNVSEALALLGRSVRNASSKNKDVGPGLEAPFTQKVSELQVSASECSVCYETMDNSNTPGRKTTTSCNHDLDICLPCLSNSIATQFTSKMWDRIGCPSCNERLDYHDIKLFADTATFGRYDNYSLEACLNGGQFQRCRIAGCSSGQQTFPEDDSYIICRECHGRTCLACDTEWHPDVTCADNIARRAQEMIAEDAAASAYIDANVKLCPNCNVRGEKVSGCDHMMCPRCRHQYCWLCLADYAGVRCLGNTGHRDDCRYHTNNLSRA